MNSNDVIWNGIINKLGDSFLSSGKDPNNFLPFFEETKLVEFENNIAVITTPLYVNKCVLTQEEIDRIIRHCFKDFVGEDVIIKVKTVDEPLQENVIRDIIEEKITKDLNDNLIPDHYFSNFVVGPSNEEAKIAAIQVSTDLGNKNHNPLIIYGDSGLGKTHLLNAIGHYVKDLDIDKKILYIPASTFVNEVVSSIKDGSIEEYKSQLNSLDLLLVDDIQSLSGKTKSNEVFFSVYNELFNNRKQMVLTCDRPPNEIKDVEERLITRFSQGLSVTISSPEFETAYDILKLMAKNHGLESSMIDDEVISYMARNFNKNVRSLEGALNRLLFYSINFSKNNVITLPVAVEAFKDQIGSSISNDKPLEIKDIISAVCDYYGLTKNQLLSKNRTKNIATARHIAMFLCRKRLDVSYDKIGEEFGGRDHSTVLSACDKIDTLYKKEAIYQQILSEIEKKL